MELFYNLTLDFKRRFLKYVDTMGHFHWMHFEKRKHLISLHMVLQMLCPMGNLIFDNVALNFMQSPSNKLPDRASLILEQERDIWKLLIWICHSQRWTFLRKINITSRTSKMALHKLQEPLVPGQYYFCTKPPKKNSSHSRNISTRTPKKRFPAHHTVHICKLGAPQVLTALHCSCVI